MVDRTNISSDLLENEVKFQENKMKLIGKYIEIYEHMTDVLEQQRCMQLIINLMAFRPRIDFD